MDKYFKALEEYSEPELDWTPMSDKLINQFIHKSQQEVIYVIQTGFQDTWLVLHEDAHEITLGTTFIGTKEEVKNKFNIKL